VGCRVAGERVEELRGVGQREREDEPVRLGRRERCLGAGLERMDRAILQAVSGRFSGGPVGLSTLAVAIGEEPDTIEDVYEPYLLQLGFLQRTPRGRVITELGREQLGASAEDTKLF